MNDAVQINEQNSAVVKTDVPIGKMRVYVCGGAPTNIIGGHLYGKNAFLKGSAEFHPVFVDTARSNLQNFVVRKEHIALITLPNGKEADGSGKKRDENFQYIRPNIPSILTAHPPMDFNVIVTSSGGGSGNVIAQCIAEQLLNEGKTFVVIYIGCYESRIAAYNTMRVIQSAEHLVNSKEKDMRIIWIDNDLQSTFDKTDDAVVYALRILAIFASRQNGGFDTMDLHYGLNSSIPLKAKPGLGTLSIRKEGEFGDINYADSVISLYTTPQRLPINIPVGYDTYGHYNYADNGNFSKSLHLVIRNDTHYDIYQQAETRHNELLELENSRKNPRTTVDNTAKVGEGDFLF